MTTETVPAVLSDRDKTKITQAVHYQHLGVMEAINRTEQAVLQSPEIQALRKDAERFKWLRNKCFDVVFFDRLMDEAPHRWDDIIDAAMQKQP